ncbi:MAG: hypothetical protein JNN01_07460, partial [Opitutaceae bacterium]|nr:hypothetical protein [Opitutaceae bacterium]
SRHVGTSANGWREWGLVEPDRKPRESYHALRREHTGFIIREVQLQAGIATVQIDARTDFPVFPPADCELRIKFADGQNRPLATAALPLRTGSPMKVPAPAGAGTLRIEIWRGGFLTATFGPTSRR